jgi:hypothetical protein
MKISIKYKIGYKSLSLSINRNAAIASASVTREKKVISFSTGVDITEPRRLIKEHFELPEENLIGS